ncbi:MAG: hypothetical protein ACE5G2_05375, partial [Candidatus Krumholzibacteriia bacterium]
MLAHAPWRLARLAGFLLGVATTAAYSMESRIVSESADGLRLVLEIRIPAPERIETTLDGGAFTRFEVPGFRPQGSAGAPELAVGTQLIAMPSGARASVRIVESDIRDQGVVRLLPRPILSVRYGPGTSPDDPSTGMPLEILRFDPQLYVADGARLEPVRLGEAGKLRHQWVVPLEVRPLLYEPRSGRLRIVRRLVVEVRMQPGGRGAREPDDASTAELVTPRSWERVYRSTVVNATSARRWLRARARVRQVGGPLKSGLLRPGLLGEDEWKLRVGETGPLRVQASTLLGAGFPDGTPVDRVRLVLKRFDEARPLDAQILEIPILVEDADGDGLFRAGDSFLFYAEHPRDDDTAGERAARYSFMNVYWLSVADAGTPARIPVRPAVANPLSGPASFDQRITYEEDRAINLWVYSDDSELYFLLDRATAGREAKWTVPVPARHAGSPLEVCVDTQQDWLRRAFTVQVEFPSGRRTLLGSHEGVLPSPSNAPPRIEVCGEIPDAQMEPGDITIVLTADEVQDAFTDTTPFVDNVKLAYVADYQARDDRVRCTSGGATGPVAYTIGGFSGQPLVVLDVTDPKSPAAFDLDGALSGGTLTLTDDVPVGPERQYRIVASAGIPSLASADVERDTRDPILEDLATLPFGS